MYNLRYFPDPVEHAALQSVEKSTTVVTPTDHTVRHLPIIPSSNFDLAELAPKVAAAWKLNPVFILIWKTQADFEKESSEFKTTLQSRNTSGGAVSPLVNSLDNLDHDIDDALPFVKAYIGGKYGPDNAPSYFASFGILHRNHSYEIPTNRQSRIESLRLMVEAIHTNGFDDYQYGKTFWTNIYTKYKAALDNSGTAKGTVSTHVSDLVIARTNIRRVLHSILLLIEANYPDTYKTVRRTWGFLKENN